MKRLPISIAVFKDLIEGNFCYVDKTPYIKQLEESGVKYWFLSRPSRFGKSLFLDTLRAAFAGEKSLFKGLFLEKNWDWGKQYPVITISFGAGLISNKAGFDNSINFSLETIANDYKVELKEKEFASTKLRELIQKLNKKSNLPDWN